MEQVFIVGTGSFLPNEAISNEEMENVLGQIGGIPSRGRAIVLRNNGIKSRYYALNSNGELTHNNAELAVEAIRSMFPNGVVPKDIDILSCGTSAADQSLPSHTAMVHGYMDQTIEICSPSGACCAGMHAMKYGYMAIRAGLAKKAISTGSELISPMMLARNFESESRTKEELDQNPYIAFEKDFLRWMLSDGAGAALMCNEPNGKMNLKIEWIESRSYAHELETCMYSAADKNEDGSLTSWKELTPETWLDDSIFAMKQDVKLLAANITQLGSAYLKELCDSKGVDPTDFDHFLPHISSNYFKQLLLDQFKADGLDIPEEKCFFNLSSVGNIGSASIYVALNELIESDKLITGQKVLLMVPESARFSYTFALLTVC